jgi:hypothetical protein
MSDRLGCVGVAVDAKAAAVDYYSRYGFSPLELVVGQMESRPEPQPMFLPLALVTAVLKLGGR